VGLRVADLRLLTNRAKRARPFRNGREKFLESPFSNKPLFGVPQAGVMRNFMQTQGHLRVRQLVYPLATPVIGPEENAAGRAVLRTNSRAERKICPE
jgi:hypothetical protein